jgi:hypothetical protein
MIRLKIIINLIDIIKFRIRKKFIVVIVKLI